jgi:hypothetical protein
MRSNAFSLFFVSFLALGCGTRTPLNEPSDASRVDGPVTFDVPLQTDVPITCAPAQRLCGGRCVDLQSDRMHCGACDLNCQAGTTCVSGRCELVCPTGSVACSNTRCVMTGTDPANCGSCGNVCAPGQACVSGTCTTTTIPTPSFSIRNLSSDRCVTREHSDLTGDDRGGIAFNGSSVVYTGDTRTVVFEAETLAPRPSAAMPTLYDGIFGLSGRGQLGTLASGRAPFSQLTSIVDALLLVNADLTQGAQVPLGSTLFVARMPPTASNGIFANANAAVFVSGVRAVLFSLSTPVPMEFMVRALGPHTNCESWAIWGALENIRGTLWVSYVRDPQTIVRQNLVTGEILPISTFANLSDMCSFTIDPVRSRWYFHHEGVSQFRDGDETLGYCSAAFGQ